MVFMTAELMPKRLELASELVPQAQAIALLVNPNNPIPEPIMREVQNAAQVKGLQLQILKAATETEIDAAFATSAQRHAGALVLGPDPFLNNRREQLVALAARHAVPTVYDFRENAEAGGLISYGPSQAAANRQSGVYAGRILKGAKPASPAAGGSARPIPLPATCRRHRRYMPKPLSCTFSGEWGACGA
jgi:putative ABC transport system substrate-binding protein